MTYWNRQRICVVQLCVVDQVRAMSFFFSQNKKKLFASPVSVKRHRRRGAGTGTAPLLVACTLDVNASVHMLLFGVKQIQCNVVETNGHRCGGSTKTSETL